MKNNNKPIDDSSKLVSEKMELLEKRKTLMKESNPLEWGDGTPREIEEINHRIKQINHEMDQLN